jgi:hypothetical protein
MLWHIESRGDVACLTMQEVMRMNTVDTVGVGDEKHGAFGIRCRRGSVTVHDVDQAKVPAVLTGKSTKRVGKVVAQSSGVCGQGRALATGTAQRDLFAA